MLEKYAISKITVLNIYVFTQLNFISYTGYIKRKAR
jgi:hypothetical protein